MPCVEVRGNERSLDEKWQVLGLDNVKSVLGRPTIIAVH
jgi:hypothetical protein